MKNPGSLRGYVVMCVSACRCGQAFFIGRIPMENAVNNNTVVYNIPGLREVFFPFAGRVFLIDFRR